MVCSLWRRRRRRSWLAGLTYKKCAWLPQTIRLRYLTFELWRARVCISISFSLTLVQYQLSMGSKQLVVCIIEWMVFAGVFGFFFNFEAVLLRNLTSLSTSWDVICNEETVFGIYADRPDAWLVPTFFLFQNLQSQNLIRRRWRIYRH